MSVKGSKNSLIDKVYSLQEGGPTALGILLRFVFFFLLCMYCITIADIRLPICDIICSYRSCIVVFSGHGIKVSWLKDHGLH